MKFHAPAAHRRAARVAAGPPLWPPAALVNRAGHLPADAGALGGLWPPDQVERQGDRLVFMLPSLPPVAPVWPDRSALVAFVRLTEGRRPPERVRRFAERWGPIGGRNRDGCPHAVPVDASMVLAGPRRVEECLGCWEAEARRYADLVALADSAKGDPMAGLDLQHRLDLLVREQGIGPVPIVLDGLRRVVLAPAGGFPGYLTLAALGLWAAMDGGGLPEWCASCGRIFDEPDQYQQAGRTVTRRPRRDRPHYCLVCRESGDADRDAARRYQQRKRAAEGTA